MLKCWTKTKGMDRWYKDKPKYRELDILKSNGKFAVFINNHALKRNIVKKKSSAIRIATKYMKEHC